jgi:hypothetical protein
MTSKQFLKMFDNSKHTFHLIGNEKTGIIIGLSLEGRLFTVIDGKVVSRVNPEVFKMRSSIDNYVNPGGDVLWPAPEGSCLGYEYPTGQWRVPPGLTEAHYKVDAHTKNQAIISAEVDLINNLGIGIPTIFTRDIKISQKKGSLIVTTLESIEYIGTKELKQNQCLLGPWSLCQFDCTQGCEVVMPSQNREDVWDLYESSNKLRSLSNGIYQIRTEGNQRFQVGISPKVEWIEYINPKENLQVRRFAKPIDEGFNYFDISDRPPTEKPQKTEVRYSVYNDTNGFMEIEAAGGTAKKWVKHTNSKVFITTIFSRINI